LVLAVAGIIVVIVAALAITRRKEREYRKVLRHKSERVEGSLSQEITKIREQHSILWLAITAALGILGVVAFFVTEDVHSPITLFNAWTAFSALLFVLAILSVLVATAKHKA